MAVSMIGPKIYCWDRNGKPLAFGKLYTYQARTNEPKPTYQSEDQVVPNTNPVILNGEGYANVYLSGSYKMVLKDKDENEIWTADPVSESGDSGFTYTLTALYLSSNKVSVRGNHYTAFPVGASVILGFNDAGNEETTTVINSIVTDSNTEIEFADPVVRTSVNQVSVANGFSVISSYNEELNKYVLRDVGNYAQSPIINEYFEFVNYNGNPYFAIQTPYTVDPITYPDPSNDPNLLLGYATNGSLVTATGGTTPRRLDDSIGLTPESFGATRYDPALDNRVDASAAFNALAASTTESVLNVEGTWFLDGTVDCQGKNLDFSLAKIYTGPNLGENDVVFDKTGLYITGGYFEDKDHTHPTLFKMNSMYRSHVDKVSLDGFGAAFECDGIIVGATFENIFALVNKVLIKCNDTGVSTTLTTNNIYCNYCVKFLELKGQLFGHYADSLILENMNGQVFDMTSEYQAVNMTNAWFENGDTGRVMDLDPGVGQQFYVTANNLRIVDLSPGKTNVINGGRWTGSDGVYIGTTGIKMGSSILPYSMLYSPQGIDCQGDTLGYTNAFDYTVTLPSAIAGNSNPGTGFKISLGQGSNGQPDGTFILESGVNSVSLGVSSDGYLELPEHKTGAFRTDHPRVTLTSSTTYDPVWVAPSHDGLVADGMITIGETDRVATCTKFTIMGNNIYYADGSTTNQYIDWDGTTLSARYKFSGYGAGCSVEITWRAV